MHVRGHGRSGERRPQRPARGLSAVFLLLALASASLPGCRVFDRQRYSLVIRKPAHQYHELTELEKEELELYERTRVSSSDGFRDAIAYEPFRPFRYCHLHDSYHVSESLVACVVAPVEYPAAISGDMGTTLVVGLGHAVAAGGRAVGSAAVWVWESVFPPSQEPPIVPPDREGRVPPND